jgi:hypothetical protein
LKPHKGSHFFAAMALCWLAIAPFSSGQTPAPDPRVKDFNVNYAVPDSPAFSLLGVNPDKIEHPSTPRDLATSLVNGFDENGNFQSGLALDVNPYMTFLGKRTTLDQYINRRITRWLMNSQLSLGTTKGTSSADQSSKLGIGVHTILWNRVDPRMDTVLRQKFDAIVGNVLINLNQICGPIPAGNEKLLEECKKKLYDAIEPSLGTAMDARKKELKEKYWNSSYLTVAGALALRSQTGSLDSMSWDGAGAWATLAYGFEDASDDNFFRKHAQLATHGEWRNNELVTDPNITAKTFLQNSVSAGERLLLGSNTTNGSLEVLYRHTNPKDPTEPNQNFGRLIASVEHQISDQLWLSFSAGADVMRGQGQDKLVVSTNFKWGKSNEAKIK